MPRFKNNPIAGLAIILMLCLTAFSMPSNSMAEEKTLYQRLGGYDAISAVVDEFAERLFADKKISRFFGTLSADTREKFKQHNTSLVCSATGGACTYLGRAMPTSHQGMGVTNADFDVVAGHLVATLDKFNVPTAEKNELLGIIGSMRGQIVE
jgi:hemoglobin